MAYTELERQQFVQVFKNSATDVSRACKAFGISRKTYYEWYKDDELFKDAIDEAKEEIKDFGETQLLTLMKGIPKLDTAGKQIGWVVRPDTACIIFFNKTKNKDRGYDERHIIAPDANWPAGVSINVTSPKNAEKLEKLLKPTGNGNGELK